MHGDLRVLAGISSEERAEKLIADPMLLDQLLEAAGVEQPPQPANPLSVNSTPVCPVQASTMSITDVPYLKTLPSPEGIEFLGISYNALTGNPRGSLSSEMDPGFGFPVVSVAAKSLRKKARGFGMPDVSYVKGSKVCKFSSKASSISSVKDYQDTLKREASDDTTITAGFTVGPGSFDSTTSFSKSEKLNQFEKERELMSTISYEASAICTDYQVEINPYSELALDADFQTAINTLHSPYDGANITTKETYQKFLRTYGTHFITQLDMGGKLIITSDISSKDVSMLTQKQVDVASTLSFDVSVGYNDDGNDPKKKKAENNKIKREYEKPECCGGKEMQNSKLDDSLLPNPDPGNESKPWSVNVGVSTKHKRSETSITRDEDQVKSKITQRSMFMIGGLPSAGTSADGEWKKWANTVRQNPMPIAYKLSPIWRMTEFKNYTEAYLSAVKDIYDVDLVGSGSRYGAGPFRYGVARSSGEPISRYSNNPNRNSRADLDLELLPATEVSVDTIVVYTHKDELDSVKNHWTPFLSAPDEGFFACGLRAKWDEHRNAGDGDDKGLCGLDVRFCSIENWESQQQRIVYRDTAGIMQPWKMCDVNQYIVQIQPWTKFGSGDELGIESLKIKCANVDGHSSANYNSDGFVDIVPTTHRHGELQTAQPEMIIPGKLIHSFSVQYGGYTTDRHGIKGIEIQVRSTDSVGAPTSPIYYYKAYWDLYSSENSPIFATPIRGKVSPHASESGQLSFTNTKGQLTLESTSFYTYMDDPTRPKIAVTDFKNDMEETDLTSFSFLVASGLSNSKTMIAGIVHPDGYPIHTSFDQEVGFEIAFEKEHKPNIVTVSLKGHLFTNRVKLLVSPLWFPGSGTLYPTNAGDVTVATSGCEKKEANWKCDVHIGTTGNIVAQRHLGFSFLAMEEESASSDTALHGHIMMSGYKINDIASKYSDGVIPTAEFLEQGRNFSVMAGEGDLAKINIRNLRTGGILLKFDPPFQDIPSLIVSPRLESDDDSPARYGTDMMKIPSAVVEHVTEKEALIRVGMVNTYNLGVAAKEEVCTRMDNTYQTWSLKYNEIGPIKIGKIEDVRYCFEETDKNFIDAKVCTANKVTQQWVYDGARIRSSQNLSRCAWAEGDNGRLQIHECNPDNDFDHERFNFEKHGLKHGSNYKSLDTMHSRCLYKDDDKLRLSTKHDSRCHDGRDPLWSNIDIPKGFSTKGFKIQTSDDDGAGSFDKCLSWSDDSEQVDPFGTCGTTSRTTFNSWLIVSSETTYKLKLVKNDSTDNMYLGRQDGTFVVGELSLSADFLLESLKSTGRIAISGTDRCMAWERNLEDNNVYDVDGSIIFKPMGFNFFAIAPSREEPKERNTSATVPINKVLLKKSMTEDLSNPMEDKLYLRASTA